MNSYMVGARVVPLGLDEKYEHPMLIRPMLSRPPWSLFLLKPPLTTPDENGSRSSVYGRGAPLRSPWFLAPALVPVPAKASTTHSGRK